MVDVGEQVRRELREVVLTEGELLQVGQVAERVWPVRLDRVVAEP